MKRLLLLFTLFAIITSQSDIEDCSSFESSIALACSSLGNTDNRCYYTEGQCKSSLHKCEDYNPSSNFDDKSCTSIIPDDYQMVECVVDGNPKKCVPKKNHANKLQMKQYVLILKLEQIKDVFLQMENVKHIIMNVQKHLKVNAIIIYHKIVKRNAIGIQVAKKRIENVINILLILILMDHMLAINIATN